MGSAFQKCMAPRCDCESRTNLGTRWLNGSSASSLLNRRNSSVREKAERTKTTNTLTYCLIFEGIKAHIAESECERRHEGLEHVAVLLDRVRLAWLLNRFPPRLVRLCICERIPHHCLACAACCAHEQSICIPISRPNGISS